MITSGLRQNDLSCEMYETTYSGIIGVNRVQNPPKYKWISGPCAEIGLVLKQPPFESIRSWVGRNGEMISGSRTILLIERNDETRRLLRTDLFDRGYSLLNVSDFEEALIVTGLGGAR